MIALSVARLNFFLAGKRNFSLNKAKKEKKLFCGKMFFVMSLRMSDHKVLHNISLGFSRFLRSYFVLQIFGV